MTNQAKIQAFADQTLRRVAQAQTLLAKMPAVERDSIEARVLAHKIGIARRVADDLYAIALEIKAIRNGELEVE